MSTKPQAPAKLDLRKPYKHLYEPRGDAPVIVDVPEFLFLMIEGALEPGTTPDTSPAYADAVAALYGAAYALKFMSKRRAEAPVDYSVMLLEGQWWAEGEFSYGNKDNWHYNMLIRQPDHVDAALFAAARDELRAKKELSGLDRLRLATLPEGLCVQILHRGPYADEPPTIEQMHAYARELGYHLRGRHHELYLSDPRRTAPAKLKTVLRMPVERKADGA